MLNVSNLNPGHDSIRGSKIQRKEEYVMIFADKLIRLRKQSGWSQEELAEQINVTRQAVSKWEGAQAVPDLEKILRLSQLFGVSTDYLLKDEIETAEPALGAEEPALRRVTMEEASTFLSAKEGTARPIALGVLLCILSPICLMLLGAICEQPNSGMSAGFAAGVGLVILLGMVAAAVAIFISCGSKTSRFEYLEKEIFETEYGVTGMVNQRKELYKDTYDRCNLIGVCLCVLSPIFLFLGMAVFSEDELLMVICVCLTLALAGVGVLFLVTVGIPWASFEKLLQEGEYSREEKSRLPVTGAVSTAYWLTAVAVYLAWSFSTDSWQTTWVVWPVAGVLFPAVLALIRLFTKRK